ncbi:MAG: hypothetical protein BroJett015_23050 [Chloroflexota bacterium]|nr:hypothetical protein [Ardenticatenaceae bacterium]GIK56642.1 MAG: hypothetical protein BroJett015_23050 [Chloroflexota bacterium]
MTRKLFENRTISILFMGTAVLLLAALMLPLFAAAQEGELPPRGGEPPTATPVPQEPTPAPPTATPEPVAEPAQTGSRLQLHAHYGPNWQWHLTAWQELWTEVQWSDGANWYPVEGWRGQMDNISQVGGQWVSVREWWVGGENLGSGPYRWVIYERQGGAALLTSSPFSLPARGGETMVISVTVGE